VTDLSDDVLRDLLLARGISEKSCDELVRLTRLVEWCPDDESDGEISRAVGYVQDAAESLEYRLQCRSREYAPKRPPRPAPSIAELNAVFRDAWREPLPSLEWRPMPSTSEMAAALIRDDTSPGWLSRMQQPNPRDDEPR
jgi:hypothetical protein